MKLSLLATCFSLAAYSLYAAPAKPLPILDAYYIDASHHLAAYHINDKQLHFAQMLQNDNSADLVVVDNHNQVLGYAVPDKNAFRQILLSPKTSSVKFIRLAEQVDHKITTYLTRPLYLSQIHAKPPVSSDPPNPFTISSISEETVYPKSTGASDYGVYANSNQQFPISIIFNKSTLSSTPVPADAYDNLAFNEGPNNTPIPINGGFNTDGYAISTTPNSYRMGQPGSMASSALAWLLKNQTDNSARTYYLTIDNKASTSGDVKINASIKNQYTSGSSITTQSSQTTLSVKGMAPIQYNFNQYNPNDPSPKIGLNIMNLSTPIQDRMPSVTDNNTKIKYFYASMEAYSTAANGALVPVDFSQNYTITFVPPQNGGGQYTNSDCNLNGVPQGALPPGMSTCQGEVTGDNFNDHSLYLQKLNSSATVQSPYTSGINYVDVEKFILGQYLGHQVSFHFNGYDAYGNPINQTITI